MGKVQMFALISQGSHEISWPAFVTDFHDFARSTFLHTFPSLTDYLTFNETKKLIGVCGEINLKMT